MKRLLACMLVIALCLSASALAERAVYADQGGVRVYAEDGRVGLMDSEGNALCPAEYDMIRPFDGDYAIATKNGKKGVLRRDGGVALPCEWDSLWLRRDRGVAVGDRDNWFYRLNTGIDLREPDDPDDYANWFHDTLIDLATGETLLEGQAAIGMDENRIWQAFYGYYAVWGEMAPPFHTDVYDAEMNPLFSVDMALDRPLGNGLYQMSTDRYGMYSYEKAVMDADGHVLLDGAAYLQTFAEPDDGVFYNRDIENLLGRALEALGYGKNNVKWILHNLFGIELDRAKVLAGLLMDDWDRCGVLHADGSVLEARCDNLCARDEAGLYAAMVHEPIDRDECWGYLNDQGRWAIPPVYADAGPFVDGAAIVCDRDGQYHLIDPKGETVGTLTWTGENGSLYSLSYREPLKVFPVETAEGLRLANRQGEYVGEEVFQAFNPWFNEDRDGFKVTKGGLLLEDAQGRVCLVDETGRVLLRVEQEGSWFDAQDPDVLWVQRDGLWGAMSLAGPDAGEWRIAPGLDNIGYYYCPGVYETRVADGAWRYVNAAGEPLGPIPGRHYQYDP